MNELKHIKPNSSIDLKLSTDGSVFYSITQHDPYIHVAIQESNGLLGLFVCVDGVPVEGDRAVESLSAGFRIADQLIDEYMRLED